MPTEVSFFLTAIIPILIVIFVVIILMTGYVKASPDTALIISGLRKKPKVLIGKAGIKIPFLERKDELNLQLISIDVKTSNAVPTADYININVDATVNVKISDNPEKLRLAAQNFLNKKPDYIGHVSREVLEGNVREIVGQMKLTEMVSDRKTFSEKVQENAVPDLARFGLELISFNVQNFIDDNGVIENLGIDNIEQISKAAQIAKANARREVAIAEAENAKMANDAKVKAEEEIAVRNNELEIKKAALKRDADTQIAQADAAKSIEDENQRKLREVAEVNANIAKAEREAELKQKEIQLKEYELDALVRKQADAEKYEAEKRAEAELITRKNKAEAEKYEAEREAEAAKFSAEKRAEAIRIEADARKYEAECEADAIRAKGMAEAEAIEKKAEAQEKMGEASILDMYFAILPQVVANASAPLTNVDKIIQYGDGNNAKMVKDVMATGTQIMDGLTEALGFNVADLLKQKLNKNKE